MSRGEGLMNAEKQKLFNNYFPAYCDQLIKVALSDLLPFARLSKSMPDETKT